MTKPNAYSSKKSGVVHSLGVQELARKAAEKVDLALDVLPSLSKILGSADAYNFENSESHRINFTLATPAAKDMATSKQRITEAKLRIETALASVTASIEALQIRQAESSRAIRAARKRLVEIRVAAMNERLPDSALAVDAAILFDGHKKS
ncbi:hypothetical protein HK405_007547 [Cladochytrium tenue]|nr:hypothetical protein HK405_007547 [Cladochytrium tenue]